MYATQIIALRTLRVLLAFKSLGTTGSRTWGDMDDNGWDMEEARRATSVGPVLIYDHRAVEVVNFASTLAD
jgi:hypothetical protein